LLLLLRYAVEASDSIRYANKLIKFHNYEGKIHLINKKVEDMDKYDVPKVDTLISEPLGILLVNERMLESYILARDK
jgi:histone-arginine methyltransferase CARM1